MCAMLTQVPERGAPLKPRKRVPVWTAAAALLIAAAPAGVVVRYPVRREHVAGGFADVAREGHPPPYFVNIEGNMIVVRSTLGGHLMKRYRPEPRLGESMYYLDDAVAGSADGRVFVAAFTAADARQTGRCLMLSDNYGQGVGWLHDGRYHMLRRVLGEDETITF